VSLLHLVASDGFAIIEGGATGRRPQGMGGQNLDDLSAEQAELARFWEAHLIEVQTGVGAGSVGRP
jgi:hypothetical protein